MPREYSAAVCKQYRIRSRLTLCASFSLLAESYTHSCCVCALTSRWQRVASHRKAYPAAVCLRCSRVYAVACPRVPRHPFGAVGAVVSTRAAAARQCARPARPILRGTYGLRLAVQVDREELEDDVVAVERVCRLLAEVCIQLLVLIANTRTDNPNNSTNNWLLSASAAFEHSDKPPPPQRCRCYSAWSHRTAVPIRKGICLPRYYVMLHAARCTLHVVCCMSYVACRMLSGNSVRPATFMHQSGLNCALCHTPD